MDLKKLDVIIVGAGAAGLAAAAKLHEAKIRFVILEAQSRIGGRAWTVHENPTIEMGPEFIHGSAPEVRKLLSSKHHPSYDIPDVHHTFKGRTLKEEEGFWERLAGVLERIPKLKADLSMDEAIDKARIVSQEDRQLARSFFEGFDLSLIREVSAKEMIGSQDLFKDPQERKIGRPLLGYSVLLGALAEKFYSKIRLEHVVKEIRWKKGRVEIACRKKDGSEQMFSAARVLVTTSVGVLKSDSDAEANFRFLPPLYEKAKALEALEMGRVHKVVLEFDRELWSEKFDRPITMIHAPNFLFQTWWAPSPMRWPIFTAWSGGDQSRKLDQFDKTELETIALKEFSKILGMSFRKVKAHLKKVYFHDWNVDPFTLGAYAFVRVNGSGCRKALGKTVQKTLFFAGEAMSEERNGTIDGAIETAQKAAEEILRLAKH